MKKEIITGLASLILATGCDKTTEAIQAAQSEGLSNVKITDTDHFYVAPWNCPIEGDAAYHISGTAPNGQHKTGIVCCGYQNLTGCGAVKYD